MNPHQLMKIWKFFEKIPAGRSVFSCLVGWIVPYSGTLWAKVVGLDPGRVEVELKDRRRVRNHLKSIHAMALANMGELATGLALYSMMPPTHRGILVGFRIEYLKKARGTLRALCSLQAPASWPMDKNGTDFPIEGEIKNEKGDVVVRIYASWRVSPGAS